MEAGECGADSGGAVSYPELDAVVEGSRALVTSGTDATGEIYGERCQCSADVVASRVVDDLQIDSGEGPDGVGLPSARNRLRAAGSAQVDG